MKQCKLTEIYYIDDYYPYRIMNIYGEKVINPKFTKLTGGYLLDVKNNVSEGINYYSSKIINELEAARHMDRLNLIMYVPSSKVGKESLGMRSILNLVVSKYPHVRILDSLERITTINKLATGGDRSIDLHLKTIRLNSTLNEIKGKNIFIIDDVTTTGNSLLACKSIVSKFEPNAVLCIALAKTVSTELLI